MATRLGLDETVITKIRSKLGGTGGEKIVDTYRIKDSFIIDELLRKYHTGATASGSVWLRSAKMAIALVGPITINFETTRVIHPFADDALEPQPRMRVGGYFAALRVTPSGVRSSSGSTSLCAGLLPAASAGIISFARACRARAL